jgi:hypothetical protein
MSENENRDPLRMNAPPRQRDQSASAVEPVRDDSSSDRRRSALGTLSLFIGFVLLGLLAVDRTVDLPFSMPRSWYTDRSAWLATGFATIAVGWILLRDREPEREDRESASRGRPDDKPVGHPRGTHRFREVILYTRRGCHLCEVARETLLSFTPTLPVPREVDIDADPALHARFSACVPVVEIDGKIRFRGRVNEVLLRRLIAASLSSPETERLA